MSTDAKILSVIAAGTFVVLFGGIFLLTKSSSPTPPLASDISKLVREDSYQTATASAKVNLVEFGDYECPACASANPMVKQLISPDVNLIFRHFPLPMHKSAVAGALAAEAAGIQGKYWEMHNILYDDQKTWANSSNPKELFSNYAQKIGLDVEKFNQDIESQTLKDKVERDRLDGISLGVNSTPTFFVNGEKVEGLPNFDQFKAIIDSKL